MLRRTVLKLLAGLPLMPKLAPTDKPEDGVPLPEDLRQFRSFFQKYITGRLDAEARQSQLMYLLLRAASFNHSGCVTAWRPKINGKHSLIEKPWGTWGRRFVAPRTWDTLFAELDGAVHQWCLDLQLRFLDDIHPVFIRSGTPDGKVHGRSYAGRDYEKPDWMPGRELATIRLLPAILERRSRYRPYLANILLLGQANFDRLCKELGTPNTVCLSHSGVRVVNCGGCLGSCCGYLLREASVDVQFLTANMLEPGFGEFGMLRYLHSYGTFVIDNISYVTLLEFA